MRKIILSTSILCLTAPALCFGVFCDFSSIAGQKVPFSKIKQICPKFGAQMEHKAKKQHRKLTADTMITVEQVKIKPDELPLKFKFRELDRSCLFLPGVNDTNICTSYK